MANNRWDRFSWKEGDALLYDKDGNRLDPKTHKPIKDDDPFSEEVKRIIKAQAKRKKNNV